MSDLHGSPAAVIKMCFIAKAPQSVWAKSIIQKLGLKKTKIILIMTIFSSDEVLDFLIHQLVSPLPDMENITYAARAYSKCHK